MNLKEVRPKNLLKALQKLGFNIARQKGSHVFLEKSNGGGKYMTSISLHNKPLPQGTLKAILRQTGVSEEEIKGIFK